MSNYMIRMRICQVFFTMRDTIAYMVSSFAHRLKELREEKNLSQRQLAEQIKISQATISRLEKELQDPSKESIIIIAAFFGVSTDYLLGVTDW